MLKQRFIKNLAVSGFILSSAIGSACAADAGHDYRSFLSNGDIKYGQIGDSYTADLVMYLAGGIVWTTEVIQAKAEGRNIDGVSIPAPYNMEHKVGYAIGTLKSGRNQKNAARYLSYLSTDDAQNIYKKYGFVGASAEDLKWKPIPLPKR